MNDKTKMRLSIYGIISAVSFVYLILNDFPGISIPIFFIIQLVTLYFIVKNKEDIKNTKGLLLMIPIIIISLNSFISANYMWAPTNFLAVVFLYSVMFLILSDKLNLSKLRIFEIIGIVINIFEPLINFIVPFRWIAERSKNNEKNMLVKRILLGVLISVPCVFFLTMMLSSADMIFYNNFKVVNKWIEEFFYNLQIFKVAFGTFAGLYLFGHLYNVYAKTDDSIVGRINSSTISTKQVNGDVIILNILLTSILVIYTIFIAIQFRYLFSSGALPYGLNYAEYARRGFFELVFLSVLNIGLIMLITYLLKDKIYGEKIKWALFTKGMMIYLCVVTGILLVSSYYRMSLYDSAYGFTRLRILVYMFLAFEGLGLVATLIYIIKHNFNILVVYAAVCLAFYMTLNVVKIDEIIAKRNVDMYLSGESDTVDIDYLMSLSQDTIPEIIRLLDKDVEIITRNNARRHLDILNKQYITMESNWQSYNLSIEKNKQLLLENKDKLEFIY
jgi:hypothetical protein